MQFTNNAFYTKTFRAKSIPLIPEEDFDRLAIEGSMEIQIRTEQKTGKLVEKLKLQEFPPKPPIAGEEYKHVPMEIQRCVCELAELSFKDERATDPESIRSESVGSWSGSYQDQRMKPEDASVLKEKVMVKWLRQLELDGNSLTYFGC